MLKTAISSQVLNVDKVLAANEVSSVESENESMEKCGNCQKLENCSSFENLLCQEKNRQKVGIYLISMLKRTGRAL